MENQSDISRNTKKGDFKKVSAGGYVGQRKKTSEVHSLIDNRPQADQGTPFENPIQRRSNNTGLPDNLKTGIENFSGHSMDDVKVHYNSPKPAQLQAHAYAQGTNIHLGTGQEKHLAHEAWHVVQQKQGRVQPTMQMKGMVNINDDDGLEKEADVMGAKALQMKSMASPLLDFRTTNSQVFQTKMGFSEGIKKPGKIANRLIIYIKTNEEDIHKHFKEEIAVQIIALKDKRQTIIKAINVMIASQRDFGSINTVNPQHILILLNDIRKHESVDPKLKLETEIKTEKGEKRNIDEENSTAISAKSGGLRENRKDHVFQTILLGSGASIAYYLNVHSRSLNPKHTAIIGKQQPWNPKNLKEGRGINFVNHPMHMISPDRTKFDSVEKFNGVAAKLTKKISNLMSAYSGNRVNTTINLVKKTGDGWYKISTSKGIYYARKVISGLGIGPHKMEGQNKLAHTIDSKTKKKKEKRRVMHIDAFQRAIKDPNSDVSKQAKKRKLSIGVSGPNAGVDAAYIASNQNMEVSWVVSSGPAIAPGMGNKISNKGKVTLFFNYMSGWTINGQKVIMHINGKRWSDDQQKLHSEKEQQAKGFKVSNADTAAVDYLVIAQGPDVAKMASTFHKSVTKDLRLKMDEQGRFATKRSLTGDESTAIGLSSEDNSFQVIGGSAIRLLGHIDGTVRAIAGQQKTIDTLGASEGLADKAKVEASENKKRELIGYRDTFHDSLHSGRSAGKMRKVIDTLSSPTILGNDQLTPIRSQVEAQGDYMPEYIGTDRSNFTTDDQTMIAAQIAAKYASIPPKLANYATQEIIQDRKAKGVRPGTAEGGKAFNNKWHKKLGVWNKQYKGKSGNYKRRNVPLQIRSQVITEIKLIIEKTLVKIDADKFYTAVGEASISGINEVKARAINVLETLDNENPQIVSVAAFAINSINRIKNYAKEKIEEGKEAASNVELVNKEKTKIEKDANGANELIREEKDIALKRHSTLKNK